MGVEKSEEALAVNTYTSRRGLEPHRDYGYHKAGLKWMKPFSVITRMPVRERLNSGHPTAARGDLRNLA